MGLVLGFIFIITLAISFIVVMLSLFAIKKLEGKLSISKHLTIFVIAILLGALFISIGFSFYPSTQHHGVPSGDDYNLLAIKAGISGLSLGAGYLFVTLIRFIQHFFNK